MRNEKIGMLIRCLSELGEIDDARNGQFDQVSLDKYTATRNEMANGIVAKTTLTDITSDPDPADAAASLLVFAMSEVEFQKDEMSDPARHALNLVLDYFGHVGVDIDGLGADRLIMSRMG